MKSLRKFQVSRNKILGQDETHGVELGNENFGKFKVSRNKIVAQDESHIGLMFWKQDDLQIFP